jgi:hypothetical protein
VVKDGSDKSGTGTILKVERLTKNVTLVAYEAVVKTGTNNSEFRPARTEKARYPE